MKKFKQNLGAMLIVGSLIVACSSTEFKPHNEWEEKAYSAIKAKYPNLELLSYDFIRKEMRISKNTNTEKCIGIYFGYNPKDDNKKYFNIRIFAKTNDEIRERDEKYSDLTVTCDREKNLCE